MRSPEQPDHGRSQPSISASAATSSGLSERVSGPPAPRSGRVSGSADTPGSVHRALARLRLDDHLSRSCVAAALKRPTRERDEQPHRSLSDLAPGEVYRADRVTTAAGGLLPHRFTLTAGRSPWRSVLCGTVSRVTPGGCYPPPCSAEPGRSSASAERMTRSSCRPTRGASLQRSGQMPDSSVRTRMRPQSGQNSTSSVGAVRTVSRSDPVSDMLQPMQVRACMRAAPTPPFRVRRFS